MRSATCSGVPMSCVRKPSLYWTRSSKLESAHMPLRSPVDCPACCTAEPKPSTASTCALSMISRSVSRASASVSRTMTKPLRPNRGPSVRPTLAACSRRSASCSRTPSKSFPLEKYQSESVPPLRRAALELPPWKISGWGRPSHESGFGFSEKSRMR